jgi:hypothetical protein
MAGWAQSVEAHRQEAMKKVKRWLAGLLVFE